MITPLINNLIGIIIQSIKYIIGFLLGAPIKFLKTVLNKGEGIFVLIFAFIHLIQGEIAKAILDVSLPPLTPASIITTVILGIIALGIKYGINV
ncbi:hypothetical protein C9439_02990 [archaeon SCG-AAA382B04]|nr:hypothetical protein C9439_02990 [archaeon SCG-AAA382B04]